MLLQSEVPYLDLGSMLSHPDTNLVSLEGSFFRINKSVMASASEWWRAVLSEHQSEDEMTILTNISEYYLSLLCQYVCTGMILVKPNEYEDVMSAFTTMCIDMKDIVIENENTSICKVFEEQRRMIFVISCNDETKALTKQVDQAMMAQSKFEELMDTVSDQSVVGNDCSPDQELIASAIEYNNEKPNGMNKNQHKDKKQVAEGPNAKSVSEDMMDLDGSTVKDGNLSYKDLGKEKVQVGKHSAKQPISQSEPEDMVVASDNEQCLLKNNENELLPLWGSHWGSVPYGKKATNNTENSQKTCSSKRPKEPQWARDRHKKVKERQLKYLDEYNQICETPDTYFYFPKDGERNSARFQCKLCTRGFGHENQFFQHIKRHDAKGLEEAWACNQCDARFSCVPDLVRHKVSHHTEIYQECQRCKLAIPLNTYLAHTKKKKCLDVQSQCVYCGIRLNSIKCRKTHERRYKHDNKCTSCETEFNTFAEHQFHVLLKHDGKFRVRCPICLQLFENVTEQYNHTRIVHPTKPAVRWTDNENPDNASNGSKSTADHQASALSEAQRKVPDRALSDAQNFLAQSSYDNSLVCPKCSKKLRNKKSFDAHIANHKNMEEEELYNHENKGVPVDPSKVLVNDNEVTPLQEKGQDRGPDRANTKNPNEALAMNPILQSLESVQPRKILKCDKCPETFSCSSAGYGKSLGTWRFRQHFLQHEASFDAAKPWSCFFCPEKFITSKFWNDHEMEVHFKRKETGKRGKIGDKIGRKTISKCLFCGQEFIEIKGHEKEIYSHIKSEHKNKLPQCKTTLKEKLYDCICCGKRFDRVRHYKRHLQISGPYHDDKCPLCPGVKFKSWSEHKSHVSQWHDGTFASRCKLCPEFFPTRKLLKLHNRDLHKTKNMCTQCGKSFVDIESHFKNFHEKLSEFSCEKCGDVFHTKGALYAHNNAKHNKNPLPLCDLCGKAVARKNMDSHILTNHTRPEDRPAKPKPFKCSICTDPKSFTRKKLLDEHMNTHTGERPFKCKLCEGVAFASQGNLAAHVRSVHKGIKRAKKSTALK